MFLGFAADPLLDPLWDHFGRPLNSLGLTFGAQWTPKSVFGGFWIGITKNMKKRTRGEQQLNAGAGPGGPLKEN